MWPAVCHRRAPPPIGVCQQSYGGKVRPSVRPKLQTQLLGWSCWHHKPVDAFSKDHPWTARNVRQIRPPRRKLLTGRLVHGSVLAGYRMTISGFFDYRHVNCLTIPLNSRHLHRNAINSDGEVHTSVRPHQQKFLTCWQTIFSRNRLTIPGCVSITDVWFENQVIEWAGWTGQVSE